MFKKLEGTTAAVVGGGTGIGRAIAIGLDQVGARVAIGGRRAQPLEDAASGTSIIHRTTDVSDRASTSSFFDWVSQELGELDTVVIAAGTNIKSRSMAEMSPEQWDQVMQVNATGPYNCLSAVLPGMRARKKGTIVCISSVAGKRALALGGIAYSASKFAMTALGTCVSNEVASDGVRISNVYPGEVNTPILDNRPSKVSDEHRERILQPENVADLVLSLIALPPTVHVPEVVIKPLSQEWY